MIDKSHLDFYLHIHRSLFISFPDTMRPPFYSKSFQATIENAFERLSSFPPPPEDADEESLALYSKIHKSIAKNVSEIVDHFDDIAPYENQDDISDIEISLIDGDDGVEDEAEGNGDDEQEDPPQNRDTNASVTAREFLEEIYARHPVQCSLAHFRRQMIPSAKQVRLHGRRPTLLDEDKMAFERICYRYPQSSENEIENLFKNDTSYFIEFSATCKKADAISRKQRVEDRIRMRDMLLFSLHDNDATRSYINFVLRSIIAIRFAQDYSSWSMGDKKTYVKGLFSKYYELQIGEISHQYAGNERKRRLAKLFKTFKGQHEKVVTARNHLDRLYRIFGTALFLDPFWQLSTGLEAPKHSKAFGKMIALLEEDMDPVIQKIAEVKRFERAVEEGTADPNEEPEYPEVNENAYLLRERITTNASANRTFLLRVMKVVGGTDVYNFVNAFVRSPSGV
ncbi:uncharacterized protein EV420DRAFT_1769568 [Desarmillaria tabescens]|uniref:Uncharacterized protein n=1 Tax=Armillaria tabescens TaxID=1929756 RepID=A0AA39MMP5_ARMTA|nr:uncharacterized protein EV420DRAFT_1769568 [Desarmillaria tabescens]KAK0439085.1 hypothetical protein EV420DRAFT_1769568 [Desarmillaria tabescens]